MQSNNFNISTYFKRINYTGPVAADTATLHALMRHQLFSVPFENLDVQAGKIVSLAPDDIADKVLTQGRGGYCYEVNGLFAMALEAVGIPYRFVAARPMFYPARRPKTHMALIAEVDSRQWLCDLGFGSYGIRAPMALDMLDVDITQDFDTFRLSRSAEGEYLLQAKVEGKWARQYGFDLTPQEWIDFVPANYLNSTHPDAIFVQKLVVVQHRPEGREILLGDVLKTITADGVEIQQLAEGEISRMLKDRFALTTA
ncbi:MULTISPECIES: arylamine N-acetyltransferase [Enterobacter]|uniref:arylamine N-acetyltransferase family protein n=1 Tax=Enterobacter TaxID=547 RepID=UPI000FEC00D8|nr:MULTISPECIES: arylamine N-acetyltransferase [Enterobacter]MCR1301905.1 arylamine N-acetyltransferase [Enterobacter sp. FL1277]MCR1306472.1 arylamine N-acetyltransferase [Enterobacter sp. BT1271]MCR1312259.1 arylamine N-acetyltransferase [Enterobacter sp. BT855]MCR1323322.1 arylamine N-acetyltransferase [Enterobacter sp. BT1268]MCR1326848.1 arylamine N-acetyltransferase [Enterobacter sp. BT1131]